MRALAASPPTAQAALDAWDGVVATTGPVLVSADMEPFAPTALAGTAATAQLLLPVLATGKEPTSATIVTGRIVSIAGTVELRAVVHAREPAATAAQVRPAQSAVTHCCPDAAHPARR